MYSVFLASYFLLHWYFCHGTIQIYQISRKFNNWLIDWFSPSKVWYYDYHLCASPVDRGVALHIKYLPQCVILPSFHFSYPWIGWIPSTKNTYFREQYVNEICAADTYGWCKDAWILNITIQRHFWHYLPNSSLSYA